MRFVREVPLRALSEHLLLVPDRPRVPRRGLGGRPALARGADRRRAARRRRPGGAGVGARSTCSISPSSTSARPSTASAGNRCSSRPGSSRSSPAQASTPPHVLLNWIYRWTLFRLMFGAGLIKLRGDACWRDLTCLDYFFETQPMPNPLSWYFHQLPRVGAPRRRRLQPLRRADRAVRLLSAAAVSPASPGSFTIVFQLIADRRRQPVVAELADPRARDSDARRPIPVAGCRCRVPALQPIPIWPADRRRRALAVVVVMLSIAPTREHAVAAPGDEHVVQPAANREHVRRLREHHAGRATRSSSRAPRTRPSTDTSVARVRVQGEAGRSAADAAADRAVPSAAGLADVVRGDVDARTDTRGFPS